MKYKNKDKMDKYTLREMRRKKVEDSLKGDGEYLFVNNTRGEVRLGKPPIKGSILLPPGQTFIGDSYFYGIMRMGLIRLVEVIKPGVNERTSMEQKLILDQPERFTGEGQTEQVVTEVKPVKVLENQKKKEKLLTEDPIDGIEIILG